MTLKQDREGREKTGWVPPSNSVLDSTTREIFTHQPHFSGRNCYLTHTS